MHKTFCISLNLNCSIKPRGIRRHEKVQAYSKPRTDRFSVTFHIASALVYIYNGYKLRVAVANFIARLNEVLKITQQTA
jgi:hypothetical protein